MIYCYGPAGDVAHWRQGTLRHPPPRGARPGPHPPPPPRRPTSMHRPSRPTLRCLGMSRPASSQPTLAPAKFSPRQWDRLSIACLLIATLPWWLALYCPWTQIDDPEYVTSNPDVLSGLSRHTFITAFTGTLGKFWIPLTSLSLKLDATLFGPGPMGFHATNILLHIANTILLYFFLRRATGKPVRSLLVAALFSMHPLRVESVAWVTERKDVLSGFFGLLALLAYIHYARLAPHPKHRRIAYLLMCGFYLLSLLAKSILVTFPFILLLIDFWPLQRWKQTPWPKLLLEKAPVFLLAAAVSAITVLILSHDELLARADLLPLSSRLANAAISYLLYLRDTFDFRDLALFYPTLQTFPAPQVAGGLLLLLGVTAGAFLLCWRNPDIGRPALIGWLWFVGTLVPNIGLVQSGMQSRADRFTYFPSIGLFIALVWCWPEKWFTTNRAKLYASIVGVGSVIVLTVFTTFRLLLWQDPLQLYLDGLAHTQNNAVLEFTVGNYLDSGNNPGPAIDYYTRAINHVPRYAPAHFNLSAALVKAGQLKDALLHAHVALRLDPHNSLYQTRCDEIAKLINDAATSTRPVKP